MPLVPYPRQFRLPLVGIVRKGAQCLHEQYKVSQLRILIGLVPPIRHS
jgi:hypothetical protein